MELVPPEMASLVEKDEMLMALKEQATDSRMRTGLNIPPWRGQPKGESKGEEKGKAKGKGRGKKGRGPSGNWAPALEAEKPPVV